jgi:glycosyltransferase involved in cell wall biosynthesis
MICILCHSIGPYHAARYRALAEFIGKTEIIILELASREKKYPWAETDRDHLPTIRTLFNVPLEQIPGREQAKAVGATLNDLQPHVVVSVGYSDPAMRTAARWARSNNAISIMTGATWRGDKKRYFPLEWAKGIWCRTHYDAIFASGTRHLEYFAGLGFPINRIWRGVGVVDNDFFANYAAAARAKSEFLKMQLGLPERYFLCCARLAPEKNIHRLIRAFAHYREQGGQWHLVLVGSGPQEEELRRLAASLAPGFVHFAGWKQYTELPYYYALASCLVLPSISEPWGLVVNEAMACGLPVLVSRKCGCLPELCWRGINGYDFDPYDENELAELLLRVSSGAVDLERMGKAGQQIIANLTPESFARTFVDMLETIRRTRTASG